MRGTEGRIGRNSWVCQEGLGLPANGATVFGYRKVVGRTRDFDICSPD